MKILFANGRRLPPFGVGGDTQSLELYLTALSNMGNHCIALGSLNHPPYIHFHEPILPKLEILNIPYRITTDITHVRFLYHYHVPFPIFNTTVKYFLSYDSILVRPEFLIYEIEQYIRSFNPEIIFTQLECSFEVIKLANKYHIPLILFICDVQSDTIKLLSQITDWNQVYTVILSRFAEHKLSPYLQNEHIVIYPPLCLSKCYINNQKTCHKYITMANPVHEKGRQTIINIIKALPENQFLLVAGWTNIEDLNPFSKYPNVTIWPRQNDLRIIFQVTRLLLVPSVWEEAYGRIATEAQINGIPIIASNIGGLPEAVGEGGILIDNYLNVDDWIKSITLLEQKRSIYKKLSIKASKHAKHMFANDYGKQIENFCRSILNK
jgi:glycosyltransferase involved in cell wall biosynthesis